ncbi:DEAD/DEAH box helicase [Streptomyces griseus]|uniref:DEAD/DEAH box helicase n=1 Tax=Streptomyces griseus TaxID=1911 RepID=UPI000849BD59|nr:DEAD/DEAH box helicase [Streptomyces griseus]SEE23687.1 Helicase conserved C-terminal domain-containing protein [Streptomyces griseus]SQA21920.1 DEAD/DEAH box helicase [Streptomyces griseus]
MDRTLDPDVLATALGDHRPGGVLPSPEELLAAITQLEIAAVRSDHKIPDDVLATAWLLHGLAAVEPETPGFDPVRTRHALAVSAHVMDLALSDEQHSPTERLRIAFAAQAGYRRCEQEPNATAVYRQVKNLVNFTSSLPAHIDTLALEAGVVFLGFDRPDLNRALAAWRRQFAELRELMDGDPLAGTMYGPAEAVVESVHHLRLFLSFGDPDRLQETQNLLGGVLDGRAGRSDPTARWVAAHLLGLSDEMAASSLYTLLPQGTPDAVARTFAMSDPPVMTLWRPQRELLNLERGNPVDPATGRSLISVPTSAGKTLMAQLVICSHLAQKPGHVVYVSPMRSLGREMRAALRARLRLLERKLVAEQPDFPLADGSGSLVGDVDIVTPERLMHMIRNNPGAALDEVSLIVVDEAHHLAQGRRGFVLESLLALLRTRSDIRLVLLSAAVGNRAALASWLDPTRPAQEVYFTDDWRGPRRLHGLMYPQLLKDQAERTPRRPSKNHPSTTRATVPVAPQLDIRPTTASGTFGLTFPEVGTRAYASTNSWKWKAATKLGGPRDYEVFAAGAAALTRAGSVLMVVASKVIARNAALAMAEHLDVRPEAAALTEFLAETLGEEHPLVHCTRHGVAFHHADLPDDVLHAVEQGLRDGYLLALASTTTLTDGVNLPVRTVIINHTVEGDPTRGNQRGLSPAKLLNAIGRAGRAGRESEGWVILTRPYPPQDAEFETFTPDSQQLTVTSELLSEDALRSLAHAEWQLRNSLDGLFGVMGTVASDFATFVWLVLQTHAETLHAPGDRLDPVRSLLAMEQADDPSVPARWMALAEKVTAVYDATDPVSTRRWASTGTSIGSARWLDGVAGRLAEQLVANAAPEDTPDEISIFFGAPEWPLEQTLDFLAEQGAFDALMLTPEAFESWKLTTQQTPSFHVDVPIGDAVRDWISGTSIPELARTWIPDTMSSHPQALELTVQSIKQGFEHAISWTAGALINLVNTHPLLTPTTPRLFEQTAWHIRHGVDTEQAITLLTSGITSRRLAHQIGRAAAETGIGSGELRTWVADQQIDGWVTAYKANMYEVEDLLDYVSKPANPLNELLRGHPVAIPLAQVGPGTTDGPVTLTHPGTKPATIRVDRNGNQIAAIPAARHHAVLTLLDSGLDLTHRLEAGQLVTALARASL